MNIIGINQSGWISSALLIKDGKLVCGGAEERFNREKLSRKFPIKAIKFILKDQNLKIEDIDYFAVGWNPGINISKFNGAFSSEKARWRAEYLYSVPNNLLQLYDNKNSEYVFQKIKILGKECNVYFINHHDAHAAQTFFLSGFKKAAILTVDGFGERQCTTFRSAEGNKIRMLGSDEFPQSVGMLYSTFTSYLGFRPDSDEWKVMALGAYSKENNDYYEKVKGLVEFKNNGLIELDLNYFNYYNFDKEGYFTPKLVELLGKPRKKDDELEKRHYEIAAALQQVTEEILVHFLDWLYAKTKIKDLCVSGGTFMNSLFNGKIIKKSRFDKVYISSMPDDSGVSVGAGLYLYYCILGNENKYFEKEHNYFGPSFTNEQIKKVLDKYKIKYKELKDTEKVAAKLVSEGNIIGWFQGRMEFGQRALGNRSIIADPRDPKMKDKVNMTIKYREAFRPFAPSVLYEHVDEFFETNGDPEVNFMEKVYMIKKEKQKIIPAVTHKDGTGRLQTIKKKINPKYYNLIKEFMNITKVPIVLNTSFNLKGEPIVCTPNDAIRTFYTSGLDALILGDYLITK